jgi:hypothetical protein
MSGVAQKEKQVRELQNKLATILNQGAGSGLSETEKREQVESIRKQCAALDKEIEAEKGMRKAKSAKAAGGIDESDEHGLRAEDMGSPVRRAVGESGKVSVRAIASAYEKLGDDGQPVRRPKKKAAASGEAAPAAAGGGGEEDLELEDDDLELEEDELEMEEDELDLDGLEEEGAALMAAAAGGDDDGSSLELSGDDLDLGEDEDEQAAAAGAATHHTGGGEGAGITAGDIGEEEELDLDEMSDKEEESTTTNKAATSGTAAGKPTNPAATVSGVVHTTGADGLPVVTVQSHALPNNKFLREPFRVIKVDEGALLGTSKKERIWDVDFFAKKFNNLDMAGYKSFSQPASNLFRVEKHVSDPRRLILYFFDAPHPYDLILTSSERRNRFFELATLQRRNSIMWCPSLCPDGINDAVVQVIGTTILRPSGKMARVSGDGKITVARMPYEIVDFWFGCISLQKAGLPANFDMLQGFMTKADHDVYIIGVADIPANLVGKPDIGIFFNSYMGASYHLLSQTILESKDAPGKTSNGIIVFVRRSFILRTSNIDAIEIDNLGKLDAKKGDFTLTAAQVRINESLVCCVMVNVSPTAAVDPNVRSAGVRGLLNGISMGDEVLDIGVRYDYLFVAGNFGYSNAFGADDGLMLQQRSGNLLQQLKEGTPDASLKSKAGSAPFRILYECRQGTCRTDVKKYYAGPRLSLNNAAVSTDIFTLRSFLSTFGEYVGKVQFKLQNLSILNERMPNYTAGEIVFIADWCEGAPISLHMLKHGEGYTINEASIPPLRPVICNHDYLRLCHLHFSLMGFLPNVKTTKGRPKKLTIASGSIPFKNLIEKGKSKEFAAPLLYRGCVVGSLVGNILYQDIA